MRYSNNFYKMLMVVSHLITCLWQDTESQKRYSLEIKMKQFIGEATNCLCSDLTVFRPICCVGILCLACCTLCLSKPYKQCNWLTVKLWLFLQMLICTEEVWNRHSATMSPNTHHQVIISFNLILTCWRKIDYNEGK